MGRQEVIKSHEWQSILGGGELLRQLMKGKIFAIKYLRGTYNTGGLKETKEFAESLYATLGVEWSRLGEDELNRVIREMAEDCSSKKVDKDLAETHTAALAEITLLKREIQRLTHALNTTTQCFVESQEDRHVWKHGSQCRFGEED